MTWSQDAVYTTGWKPNDVRQKGIGLDISRNSLTMPRMAKKLWIAGLVRMFFVFASLTIASCGDSKNPWCNGNCTGCPTSSGTCVGRVGTQCCYCPSTAWCNESGTTCECESYVSPDIAGPVCRDGELLFSEVPPANR
jgi:hypothetical protein